MPAAPTIAQPPRITADEIPQMLDSPQFAALPHARRSQLLESALASGVEDVAGQWDKTRFQQWGQFADTARSKVASMESLPEKAAYYGRVVGGAVKDSVATIGAGVAGISPVLPDGQGGAAMQMPGKTSFQMLGANVAGLATGVADKLLKDAAPVEAELDTLKQQIDQGAFFDHEKGFTGWVDDAAAKLEKAQKAYYGDEDWARENSVLANPQNAQALSTYMRTRSPDAWNQLRDQVLKTPGMARIGAEKDKLSTESTLGKAMTPEAQRYIQEAADPAEILGTVAGVGAGVKAAKAGQTMLQRAGKLAAGVGAEVASEQVSAFMDNPNMSWEQRLQVAKDALAAGLGFAGIGAASQIRLPKRNATPQQPATAGSIDNPFEGPINAPPQPTEAGGVLPPAGPQPVPAFTDNPFGTVAPQPAGGNVLIDYGIPRTPQAQAAVDAAQAQVAQSQAQARGQQNMAGNRMPLIPDNPLGYRDILDFVNDNPLNIPRKGSDAATAAEYDWTRQYEMPQYYRKFLASSERGFNASDLADMAFKEGYIQDASPDALLEQIDKTIRERTQFKVEFRKQQQAQNDEARRLTNFDKAQQQASRVESTQLPLDAVVPGDSFTLKGEDVKVRHVEHDEDGNVTLVQIEDGQKFGILNLDPQTRGAILVDEFKPRATSSTASTPATGPASTTAANAGFANAGTGAVGTSESSAGGSGGKSVLSSPEPDPFMRAGGYVPKARTTVFAEASKPMAQMPKILSGADGEGAGNGWNRDMGMSNNAASALSRGKLMEPDFKVWLADHLGVPESAITRQVLAQANNNAQNLFREYHHVGPKRDNVEFYDPEAVLESPKFFLGAAKGLKLKSHQERARRAALKSWQDLRETLAQAGDLGTWTFADETTNTNGVLNELSPNFQDAVRSGRMTLSEALQADLNSETTNLTRKINQENDLIEGFQQALASITAEDKAAWQKSNTNKLSRSPWEKKAQQIETATQRRDALQSELDALIAAHPAMKMSAPVTRRGQVESSARLGERGGVTVRDSQQPKGAGTISPQSTAKVNTEETLAMAAPAVTGPLPSTYAGAQPGGYQGATPQLPQPQQPRSGKVQTLHGIRQFLLDAVGLPAVGVKRFTKAALGIYKIKPEAVRLQAINDIPVLAHEIGHHVHYRFLSATPGTADSWNGRHDAELMPLGRPTSTPQYTPDQVRKEGVAEFTRLWLTNPVQARAQAPAFAAFWEQELQAKAPQIAEGMRTAQGQIADYIAMPAFEKAKAQIVFDPDAERQDRSLGDKLRTIYAQMFNTLQPALDVTRQAAQMDPTLADQAADVEMRMENHRGGWPSKANSDIFGEQTDLHGKVVGPGLKTILSDLQPGENVEFSAYIALKRAQELESVGKRSGFEQARLPGAEMRMLEARFEPTRKKLQRWMKNERNLLVQAGLLDAKSAQAMDDANADYVPFYRLYEKLNGVSFGPEQSKNSGGYVDLNSGIRSIKGSDRAIIDPLQSAMKNAFMFRKLAEQNHIGVKFFNLVREVQGGGQWGETIRPKMKPVVTSHEAIVQKLIDEGVIKDASMLPQNADLTLRLFQAITKPDTKNGEVIIFKDGKREHWEIKDPMLMQALKTADADAVKLGNIPGWMLKIFTSPTKLLRWGATGGPWFAIPNFIRDSVQGGVMSRSGGKGFVPFLDSFKGALEILRKGGAFEKWKQAGGEFSGVVTGTQAFTRLLEDALPKDPIARRAMAGLADPKAWRGGFRNALDLVGAFGKFTEESTRLGEFMRAKREGSSDMAAANLSKIVSLNFARAGEVSRVINQFVPFFNATLQGLDQLVRAHADPKVRTATIIKGLSYITLPSVLVWALGKDDEEIQNLPDYRKNLFWNINLKPMAAALGMPDAGFILSIPKPFLLGAIYGTSVERALDYATGRDPNGARKAAKNILANTMNPFDVMMSVGGIRPVIEATTNYSLFTGRNIVPEGYTHLPKEQQYSLLTSQTARMLGQATGQSPMMIDHLLRGYFATVGQFGTDAIDYGMAKLSLTDVPPPPRKGLMELPILNRFSGSPYAANAFVGRFYQASSDMEGKLAVFNKQAEQMTSSEQQKWFAANREELGHYLRIVDSQTGRTGAGDIRAAQRTLSELNAAMKDIQASRVLTPEVKRARMIELTTQRNGVAENAYNQLFPTEVRKRHY